MALGVGDFVFRLAIQLLLDVDLVFSIEGRLPLLPDLARIDGSHLRRYDVPTAEEYAEILLGSMVGENCGCRGRHDCRATYVLRRLLGWCSGSRRSVGPRSCRTSLEDRCQILRRLLVPALRRAKALVRQLGQARPLCGMQPGRSASSVGAGL